MVGMLDARTRVDVSATIEIAQRSNSGAPWGVNGNYAQIRSKGQGGGDLLRFVGVNGVSNRGLTIEKLVLDGGDPYLNGTGAAACLHLAAPLGDAAPLYKFMIRD